MNLRTYLHIPTECPNCENKIERPRRTFGLAFREGHKKFEFENSYHCDKCKTKFSKKVGYDFLEEYEPLLR